MINEILLMASIVILYGAVILMYKFFGTTGIICWTCIATVLANIEVLRVVEAFGVEQTLGNVLFATTFLVTDIIHENHGAEEAKKAVRLSIVASIIFVVISQSWLLYDPASTDWAGDAFETIFANTPRLVGASLAVYAICQFLDVHLYGKWWELTERKCGDRNRFLWLRNNLSTLISQAVNTVLYNVAAFAGIYDFHTLVSLCIGGYIIFVITSLCDTPVVYMCRKIGRRDDTSV